MSTSNVNTMNRKEVEVIEVYVVSFKTHRDGDHRDEIKKGLLFGRKKYMTELDKSQSTEISHCHKSVYYQGHSFPSCQSWIIRMAE